MNTIPETEEIERKQRLHRGDLRWAQEWCEGQARCPNCSAMEFGIPDAKYEDHARYETFSCLSCSAHWKVELRETALAVLRDDDVDHDWIELDTFDESPPVRLSERERAAMLAALHCWQRERLASSGHERDIETAFDHLQPLPGEEIDALCERVAGVDRDHSGALKT